MENGYSESLMEQLQTIIFMLVLTIIMNFIAYFLGFFSLPKGRENETSRMKGIQLLGAFSVFLFIALLISPIISYVVMSLVIGEFLSFEKIKIVAEIQGWSQVISIALTALLIRKYFLFLDPTTRRMVWGEDSGKSIRKDLKDFFVGVVCWFLSFPLITAIGQSIAIFVRWGFHTPSTDQVAVRHIKAMSAYPTLFAATAFAVVLVVPIIEEVLFRGFLQTWLRQRIGVALAVACTSITFALFHYSESQGAANIEFVISLSVLSCFLGFLYERQRSLWANIGLHSTFNGISIMMIIFQT